MLTYVLAKDGSPLMPTYHIRKVRHMLRGGRAVIAGHKPGFTIRLTYDLPEQAAPHTQEVELCEDTGYRHIGVSVKSARHEFAHLHVETLPDEKQRHDAQRRYRRMRRSRLRHRAPRFDNRTHTKPEGWLAPSLRHKADLHVRMVAVFRKVLPLRDLYLEAGSFDTQALEAVQEGRPLPAGADYQHGRRNGIATLREAVFYRDSYTCRCCGKGIREGKILRVHHLGYWKTPPDHTDRMGNLVTLCTDCHTPANHRPGGRLFGWEPAVRPLAGAAFMNTVRWQIAREAGALDPSLTVHTTYGAYTRVSRRDHSMAKTHANDAYCMGLFQPKHHAPEVHLRKKRRNNRVLSKFYDALYLDVRDGKRRHGQDLSCGRTCRSESRRGPKNQRLFRGRKVRRGRIAVRRRRYPVQPGTLVLYQGQKVQAIGTHANGARVLLPGKRDVPAKQLTILRFAGGFVKEDGAPPRCKRRGFRA